MLKGRPIFLCFAAALLAVALQGCEEDDVIRYDKNRPPETTLSVAPLPGDRIFHKYRVHWTGLDRDGVVVSYRVASLPEDEIYGGRTITTDADLTQYFTDQEQIYLSAGRSFWKLTDATESLFVFSADRPNTRNHSLYVAAVDNEGKVDQTPAATNFMAIDYGIPEIEVCIASNINPDCRVPGEAGDTLPAYNLLDPAEPVLLDLRWGGSDPDGVIREWKYRLDSSAEVAVGTDVVSKQYKYDPNDQAGSDVWIGFHEFRLVAIDDAGAESNEKVTRFVINYDPDTYIDSVWTFRDPTPKSPLPAPPPKLIYPSDSLRVVYHFGRLKLKFHGADIDGAAPDSFRWNIRGTLIQSVNPANSKSPWVGDRSDDLFVSRTPAGSPYLDTDSPLLFFIRAKDSLGKVDGSPDTIVFMVNYTPRIGAIAAQVISPDTVKFTWECSDPDQDIDRLSVGGDRGLILYKYRVDDLDWTQVTTKVNKLYVKECTVEGLAPGQHKFRLQAWNGDYQITRSDVKEIEFEVPNLLGGGR